MSTYVLAKTKDNHNIRFWQHKMIALLKHGQELTALVFNDQGIPKASFLDVKGLLSSPYAGENVGKAFHGNRNALSEDKTFSIEVAE